MDMQGRGGSVASTGTEGALSFGCNTNRGDGGCYLTRLLCAAFRSFCASSILDMAVWNYKRVFRLTFGDVWDYILK